MLFNLISKAPVFMRHVGVNAVANILAKAQLFIVAVVLSRFFALQEFASFGVLLTIVGLVTVFASVGLGPAVIRFVAAESDPRQRDLVASSALTVNAVLALLLCIGLYAAIPAIESALGYVSADFSLSLSIICPGIFFVLVSQLCVAFLNGVERFDLIAKSQFVTAFVALPLQLLLSLLFGLPGFAVAFLVSHVLLIAVLGYFTVYRDKLLSHFGFDRQLSKRLLAFSLPSFISGIWPMPLMALAFWRISALDDAAFQAALLTSANQVFSILYFLPVMVAQVLMPKIAAKANDQQQAAILTALLRKLIPLMLAGGVLLLLFSPMFPLMFNLPVSETLWVFVACIVTVLMVSVQTQMDHYNVGRGKVWLHCALNTLWGLMFLVSIEYFYVFGALGIVLARLLAYFLRSLAILRFMPSLKAVKE